MTHTLTMGEFIHDGLRRDVIIESEPWALQRIEAILTRFHSTGRLSKNYKVVIPWLSRAHAFTCPGEHIFLARHLFQECATDGMAAMIIAHEIAHHELGHLDRFERRFKPGSSDEVKWLLRAVWRVVEARIKGVEQETDADVWGMALCMLAGYDFEDCIRIFEKFQNEMLDYGDIAGVYGPTDGDEDLDPDAPLSVRIRARMFNMKRGYLPMQDRIAFLRRQLEGVQPAA